MRNITLFIATILISGSLFAQTQPLNPSFENWTTSGSISNPDSWSTTNTTISTVTFINVTEDTIGAQDGSSYAKLETKDAGFGNIFPGAATLGIINLANQTVTGGMAYTDKPLYLKGYYKYNSVNSDTSFVLVYFTKWNGTSKDTLGMGGFIDTSSVSSWALFTDTIYWKPAFNGVDPDSMNIVISSSSMTAPQVGSILEIDNLYFEGLYVGVDSKTKSNFNFTTYPNPVKNVLNVTIEGGEKAEITLFNTVGQEVYRVNTSIANNKIDVSNQNRGIYFIKVKMNNKVYTKKVFLN